MSGHTEFHNSKGLESRASPCIQQIRPRFCFTLSFPPPSFLPWCENARGAKVETGLVIKEQKFVTVQKARRSGVGLESEETVVASFCEGGNGRQDDTFKLNNKQKDTSCGTNLVKAERRKQKKLPTMNGTLVVHVIRGGVASP